MNNVEFPRKSFRIVYIAILLVTLAELVSKLSGEAPLGFMTLIDGAQNADVGRGLLWSMFASWALFIFTTYLEMEAFEDNRPPFDTLQQPNRQYVEFIEWGMRLFLIGLVTVKLWKPESYQQALFSLAGLSGLLFAWSVLVTASFKARWSHVDFALLALSAVCGVMWWFASDHEREANFGVAILIGMTLLTFILLGLGLLRIIQALAPVFAKIKEWVWPAQKGVPAAAAAGATGSQAVASDTPPAPEAT